MKIVVVTGDPSLRQRVQRILGKWFPDAQIAAYGKAIDFEHDHGIIERMSNEWPSFSSETERLDLIVCDATTEDNASVYAKAFRLAHKHGIPIVNPRTFGFLFLSPFFLPEVKLALAIAKLQLWVKNLRPFRRQLAA